MCVFAQIFLIFFEVRKDNNLISKKIMMFLIIDFYVFCIFPELCIITVYAAEMFWKLDIKMFILPYSLLSGASNEQIVYICPHQAPCS